MNISHPCIRVGIIGLGYRGHYLYQLLSQMPVYQVVGLADPALRPEYPPSLCYDRGADDYRRMIEEAKPDLVVIASPWQCHLPQAEHALRRGVHVALEIRGGDVLGEYTQLIELGRAQGKRIYPLENAVFMRECLAVQGMVQAGLFGDLVSLCGGYRHDLRHLFVGADGGFAQTPGEGQWRAPYYTTTNADLYPTHGLAPIGLYASLGRGNRATYLTSFASRALGLGDYIARRGGPPISIATGDVISTHIETEQGILIRLTHDTTLPRPRSLDYEVQGTRGIWQGEHRRIYIEGDSPYGTWQSDEPYVEQYLHSYWRLWGQEAMRLDEHHRGMDYIMLRAVVADLAGDLAYPIAPEDLALWCSITPLSALSIARGERVKISDSCVSLC